MKEEKKIATRQSYGEALAKLGEKNNDIVVLDADLSSATKTNIFAEKFPDRFINVGIAEQNLMGTAAGLAAYGKVPFVSTFAIFAAGRAYDQIRNSICYPKLNVKICATHAGLTVGEDGATHQMLEDLSLMRTLPNMTVISPSDDTQTRWAIEEASKIEGPVYVRLARMATPVIYDENQAFEIGKMIQLGEGTDATVFATGVEVAESLKAQEELAKEGINIRVIDVHTIKPLDKELIYSLNRQRIPIVTVEEHILSGGLGSAVADTLIACQNPVRLLKLGIPEEFLKAGDYRYMLNQCGLNAKAIATAVREADLVC